MPLYFLLFIALPSKAIDVHVFGDTSRQGKGAMVYCSIVNREEGLEAGGVSDNMLKFWSRDNTSALESRLVIRAVQKIKLCLAKRLVFLPRSRKS